MIFFSNFFPFFLLLFFPKEPEPQPQPQQQQKAPPKKSPLPKKLFKVKTKDKFLLKKKVKNSPEIPAKPFVKNSNQPVKKMPQRMDMSGNLCFNYFDTPSYFPSFLKAPSLPNSQAFSLFLPKNPLMSDLLKQLNLPNHINKTVTKFLKLTLCRLLPNLSLTLFDREHFLVPRTEKLLLLER